MTHFVTDEIHEFAGTLPARGRLLGIDLGTKTIGMAVSDPDRLIATGRETRPRRRSRADADMLKRVCAEDAIAGLVVGLPINMNGTEGPRAQSSRAFAATMAAHLDLPVLLWDERLSTAAVTRAMVDADLSRRRRAKVVDTLAAAYILQGALDGLARLGGANPG